MYESALDAIHSKMQICFVICSISKIIHGIVANIVFMITQIHSLIQWRRVIFVSKSLWRDNSGA